LIRHFVLEQEHVALTMRSVYITAKACSNNMIISQSKEWAVDSSAVQKRSAGN